MIGATSVLPAPTSVFDDAFVAELEFELFELPPHAATASDAATAVAAMVMRVVLVFMAMMLPIPARHLGAAP
jgi:hypothetical protein